MPNMTDKIKTGLLITEKLHSKDEIVVKLYDFKKPDKFSFEQIRTLSMIHEWFAREITTGLSDLLKKMIHIKVASVDQMTYEEFIRMVPDPTPLAIIDMSPLKGNVVLELDYALSFSFIDRLLGGKGEYNEKYFKELTEIEWSLIEEVVQTILSKLNISWGNVLPLDARLNTFECNPCFATIVPPKDMIVLVTLEAKLNGTKGFINLCLPYITIEPIIPKLSAKYWYSSINDLKKEFIPENISNIMLDSKLIIKGENISLKKLSKLSKGSLIKLTDFNEGNAYIFSSDKPVIKLKQLDYKKRRDYQFEIIKEIKIDDLAIFADDSNNEKNKTNQILNDSIEKLMDSFNKTINNLDKKIEKISKNQDSLVDQISFTTQNPDLISDNSYSINQNKPFDFLRSYEISCIIKSLYREYPQTIAMIISYIEPVKASSIITEFPEEIELDIIERIAILDRTSPAILKKIEIILEKKLKILERGKYLSVGGIDTVIDLLTLSPKKIENEIIKKLEKKNPELTGLIKQRLFNFEDILSLSNDTIQIILQYIDNNDLLLVLKTASEELKKKILSCLNKDQRNNIEIKLENLANVRFKLIEDAQARIVMIIKKLEEDGVIELKK